MTSNWKFHCSRRFSARKALLSGLAVLAIQGASLEMVYGQTGLPIAFGQVVQGTLGDANDAVLSDGRPIDQYRVVTQVPGQTYAIRAISPGIPVVSTLSFFDPAQQQLVPLQQAHVFSAGQQLLYAGNLAQPGEYIINIFAFNLQQPIGAYTLSLSCLDDDDEGLEDDGSDDCPNNGLGDDGPGDDNGGDDGPGDDNGGDDGSDGNGGGNGSDDNGGDD